MSRFTTCLLALATAAIASGCSGRRGPKWPELVPGERRQAGDGRRSTRTARSTPRNSKPAPRSWKPWRRWNMIHEGSLHRGEDRRAGENMSSKGKTIVSTGGRGLLLDGQPLEWRHGDLRAEAHRPRLQVNHATTDKAGTCLLRATNRNSRGCTRPLPGAESRRSWNSGNHSRPLRHRDRAGAGNRRRPAADEASDRRRLPLEQPVTAATIHTFPPRTRSLRGSNAHCGT